MAGIRLLVVNANDELCEDVAGYLKNENLLVDSLREPRKIALQIEDVAPSLILLYHSSQRDSGFGLLREIRRQIDVPVIMLLAGGTNEADMIIALELGADDCLFLPFVKQELLARVRAVVRRSTIRQERPRSGLRSIVYRFSGWHLHQPSRLLVSPQGLRVSLSKLEYALLSSLIRAAGRTLTREFLIEDSRIHNDAFDRAVDVLIYRLRRKLRHTRARPIIETVPGHGYRLCVPVERLAFK